MLMMIFIILFSIIISTTNNNIPDKEGERVTTFHLFGYHPPHTHCLIVIEMESLLAV